jgi:hypothetical protein
VSSGVPEKTLVADRVEYSAAAQGPVMSDLNMIVIGGGRERTRWSTERSSRRCGLPARR